MKTLCILLLLFCSALFAATPATTVILVRHAEKVTEPADDENPGLTDAGRTRAERLAMILAACNLKAVYSTQYTRTRLTAEPTAKEFGLQITQVDATKSKKLVDDILTNHGGQTVLVVGHSNTLAEIIQLLGGGPIVDIGDNDYDNLFIVTVYAPQRASLLLLKY